MKREKSLKFLIKNLAPKLNEGDYVFVSVKDLNTITTTDVIFFFKEPEGITLVLEQSKADFLGFEYDFITSWITLMVHSSLEAIGLTAIFSKALAKHDISCNVVAGYYHDHIFVDKNDAEEAMEVLKSL